MLKIVSYEYIQSLFARITIWSENKYKKVIAINEIVNVPWVT